jgi:hypothetical protein
MEIELFSSSTNKIKELSELLSSMHSMELYVNVHTTQYQDGEIRGQISNSTSDMMMK